jgi:hypothetical protein
LCIRLDWTRCPSFDCLFMTNYVSLNHNIRGKALFTSIV